MMKLKFGYTILGFVVCFIAFGYAQGVRRITPLEQVRSQERIVIMIDPYGDVRSAGRVIGNRFESELTHACAQKIKQEIEREYDYVSIVISRTVGEQSYELARAQYANRLEVRGFFSIQFFHETAPIARWFMYRYGQSGHMEFKPQSHSFLSIDQAYLIKQDFTDELVRSIDPLLGRKEQKCFEYQGVATLPCSPLKGVIAPALLCEVGLKSPDDWMFACHEIKEIIRALIALIEDHA